jgi:hypothetical protein
MLRLLEPKTIATIFSNIEDILLTNTAFLSSLEERQRSCRLYIDTIGDILDRDMINMIAYKVRLFLCLLYIGRFQLHDLGLLRQSSGRDQGVAIFEGQKHRFRCSFTGG